MDFDSLKNQVSNLTLYDIKAGFRKAQNAVMNYTEMEAKVREATNNEPWGASTSTMQEIANGTFSYATLNEIMPMIYKRFTEKSAEEWRQIYKALQLLEFLIKNGSERVIDDARSHLSLLKMLRQFHFIDMNGKDQGINVRNRAKELSELLSDVDRIRGERKKARQTRGKYGGVEGGASFSSEGMGRYGGYGSESAVGSSQYGGFSGGVYGDGGGFGGNTEDSYGESQGRRDRFEEYDEGDSTAAVSSPTRHRATASTSTASKAKAAPPKTKEPEVDLFDFSADDPAPAVPSSNGKQPAVADDFGSFASASAADDEFDDFQSATSPVAAPPSTFTTTSNTQFAQPKPMGGQSQGMNSIISTISPPPSSTSTPAVNYAAFKSPPPPTQAQQPMISSPPALTAQQSQPSGYQASTPNYFGSIPVASASPATSQAAAGIKSPTTGGGLGKPTTATKSSSGADPFASLSLGTSSKKSGSAKGPSMAAMAKEKSSAGIWGPSTTQSQGTAQHGANGGGAGGSGNDLLGL